MKIDRYRVRPGDRSAIERHRPDDTGQFRDKDAARERLQQGVDRIRDRQKLLYAQGEHALLVVLQGMDAAGKDSAITHVMSGANPLGTDVHAFKQPSSEELSHDFLWRAEKALPARGRIGIFNRSYYEDVLVVRVHPDLLGTARLPSERVGPHIWKERFEDIRAFERHLWRNGTTIRKVFLHVSRATQRQRLLERMDDPVKNWKFSSGDIAERERWDDYMDAYRRALASTSTRRAPWYVVPADHKWFAHLLIAEIIVEALDDLKLEMPSLAPAQKRDLALARRKLLKQRRA